MKTQKLFYNIFKKINKLEIRFYHIDKATGFLCIPEVILKFKISDISDNENIHNEIAMFISSEFYNIEEINLSDEEVDKLIINIVEGYMERILRHINKNGKMIDGETESYFSSIHFQNDIIGVIDEYRYNTSEDCFQNFGGVDEEDKELIFKIFS